MKPDFTHSTIKTNFPIDDNSTIVDTTINNGTYGTKTTRTYRIRIHVKNSQEEMTEYIKFTNEVSDLRKKNKLTVDKDDSLSHPSFVIQYPKENIDGSYFIIKNYTFFLDT